MKWRVYENKKALDRFIKRLEREKRDYRTEKKFDFETLESYYVIEYEESKRTMYIEINGEKVNFRKVFKKK